MLNDQFDIGRVFSVGKYLRTIKQSRDESIVIGIIYYWMRVKAREKSKSVVYQWKRGLEYEMRGKPGGRKGTSLNN